MDVLDILKQKAKSRTRTVVFPEGEADTILAAAVRLKREGLLFPVLLGNRGRIVEAADRSGLDVEGLEIIQPRESERLEPYVDRYCRDREMPASVGRRFMQNPLYFGCMMVKAGDAHGLVAGLESPTEEVIMAATMIIGLKPGIGLVSSFFLMDVPGFVGGEGGRLIFADPAVNPDPESGELADIALTTAASARELFDWEPRVAMLSFSTKGSAEHPKVEKVVRAVESARQKDPSLLIEGELQADAAIVESVARKKIGGDNRVAGKANILIFPDLNSANIGSKLVQRLAGANSYGPVLQGFARPVSDLSRGATTDDIFGAALMVAARDGA